MSKTNILWRKNPWVLGWLAVFVMVVVVLLIQWNALPPDRYILPKAAADWAAWGTCIGAVGTISAVVYAARTLKTTSVTQLEQRGELDLLEQKEGQAAMLLRPDTKAFALRYDEGPSPEATGARILVENWGEHPFHEVQIHIQKSSLSKGQALTNFEFWEADLEQFESGWRSAKRWEPADSAPPVIDEYRCMLGTVEPKTARSVSFDFSEYENYYDWVKDPNKDRFAREQMLVVTFIDHKNKSWVRTSHDLGKITRIRRDVS